MKRTLRALGCLLLSQQVLLAGIDVGTPLFTDSFDTPLTFAENWIAKGGAKSADGEVAFAGGELTLRRELPPEFYAECDLTLEHDMKKPCGFGGMSVAPFLFQAKPEGKAFLLWHEIGSTQSCGNYTKIDNFEFGRPIHIAVARAVKGDVATYTYFINGKQIGSFRARLPEKDKDGKLPTISFGSWRVDKMRVDNFRLSTLKKSADESPNLTVNSSFETLQDGFPLYVTRQGTSIFPQGDKFDYERYLATVSADDKERHSGEHSLKLVNNELTDGQSISFHRTGTVLDRPGVLSLWLKADRDDMKATIQYGGPRKDLVVGKEWKRYEVVNPKLPGPGVYSPAWLKVPSSSKGTLWVDDVQAELLETAPAPEELKSGKTFATAYRPSELDKLKLAPEEKPERAPAFSIPKLPASVNPSADLDAWKGNAVKLDTFHYGTKEPRLKTEAYLACDDDNLYLAYRNFGEDFNASKLGARDNFGLFSNGAECFFDPCGNGDKSLHFATNAKGVLCDLGFGDDISWNGDWKSEAVKNEKLGSVDYLLTFPMANFAGSDIAAQWLVNVCRNDGVNRENACVARIPTIGYKKNEYWPKATLPESVVRAHSLGVVSAASSESDAGNTLMLLVRNLTGGERQVKVSASDLSDAGKVVGEREASLKEGDTTLVFPAASAPKRVGVKIADAEGRMIFNRDLAVEKRSPVSMLGRLSFYMNETEAVFQVALNLPDADKLAAVLECAGKKVEVKASQSFKVALPIQNLKPGTYEAKLSVLDGAKVVGAAKGELVKREFLGGAAQINHFSRSVVKNGKPVFHYGPFVGDFRVKAAFPPDKVVQMLNLYERYGFKSTHILVAPDEEHAMKAGEAFLKSAEGKGINVMLWLGGQALGDADYATAVKRLKSDNIISYQVLDEPELSKPSDWALNYMRRKKPLFPYHPMHMNNSVLAVPGNYANLETDILMLDDYLTNAEKRSVQSVVQAADEMWKAGAAEGKPCYYFLVGGNFPLHYREPSHAEQIAQSYGCIAAGCTGISFFYGWPQTPGNWRACVQLAKETTILNDVLTSEEECAETAATGNPKFLRHRTKKHDGSLYVVSCNIDEFPAGKVTFTLPAEFQYAKADPKFMETFFGSGDAEAEVMFEDRKISVKDGKFSDDFGGHARHVYKIKLR